MIYRAMRWAMLAVLLAACDSIPDPPSPEAFAKLSADDKIKAVYPRAGNCVDELTAWSVHDIDPALADAVKADLANKPASGRHERIAMFVALCAGDEKLVDRIYACWKTDGCSGLIACLDHH